MPVTEFNCLLDSSSNLVGTVIVGTKCSKSDDWNLGTIVESHFGDKGRIDGFQQHIHGIQVLMDLSVAKIENPTASDLYNSDIQ